MATAQNLASNPISVQLCPYYTLPKSDTLPIRNDGHIIRKIKCTSAGNIRVKCAVGTGNSTDNTVSTDWVVVAMATDEVLELAITHLASTSTTATVQGAA
jgi:hypothetical protein